jgi:uncharacterized protein (TIGR03083 family)
MAAAVEDGIDRPVVACPGWAVRDLAHHTGEVLRFWTALATGEMTDPRSWDEPPPPPDEELADWLRAGGTAVDAVYDLDPTTPMWSWSHRDDLGFVHRRMAQEVAVHCFDAVLAVRGHEPVERDLAVDGVSEYLDTFLPMQPELLASAPSIDLEAVDTGDRWRIGPEDGLAEVSIEATASDLLLLLWKRPTAVAAVIDGDEAAWDAFLKAVDLSWRAVARRSGPGQLGGEVVHRLDGLAAGEALADVGAAVAAALPER